TRPEAGSATSAKDLHVLSASTKTSDEIAKKCRIPTVISQVSVEALATTPAKSEMTRSASPARPEQKTASRKEQPAGPPPQKVQAPPSQEDHHRNQDSHAHAENILRVDAERIDNMISLVGELIIGKSMLQ